MLLVVAMLYVEVWAVLLVVAMLYVEGWAVLPVGAMFSVERVGGGTCRGDVVCRKGGRCCL